MPYVEQSIVISAPPEAVFELVAHQPERLPEWWPAFEQQERVTPPPTGVGSVARYVYNMMGVRIKGENQVLEMDVPERLLIKTLSGIDCIIEYFFVGMDGGTEVTLRFDYSLPGSVLGHMLNRLTIEQRNERDLAEGLLNLKHLLEPASSS